MSLRFSIECDECGKQLPLYESIEGGEKGGCVRYNRDYESRLEVEIQLPKKWQEDDDGLIYCPSCWSVHT